MNYLSLIALICLAAVVVNASDSGYYVPKGYYVIHSDGQQSELSKISPSHELLMHRLRRRRSAQYSSSSSSSSSSVSSNGGPISFHQSSSSVVSPGGSQGYYPAIFGVNNRFNGDDDYYDGGHYSQFNNNRPAYPSTQTLTQTGTFAGNGYRAPTYSSTQTVSGNLNPNNGNTYVSQYNNNRPAYASTQTQTGAYAGNGFSAPTITQTQTGNALSNRINTHISGSLSPNNGNTFVSQTSTYSQPSPNGNVVVTQSNNNGFRTETTGIVYPNGQVQITSHKTG